MTEAKRIQTRPPRDGYTHGQGKGTPKKQMGFAAALAVSLDISKGGQAARFPYWHIDLNAGSGFNAVADCEGSPLVFLRAAVAKNRRFNACFCDINPDSTAALRARIGRIEEQLPPGSTTSVHTMDNGEFLQETGDWIGSIERPQFAVGTLLCDPNGFKHGFPLDGVQAFASRFPRIDVILNLNASLFARVAGCKRDGQEAFYDWPDLPAILDTVGKKHWLVGQPTPGHERFITFVGRTTAAGYKKFFDFFPRTSPGGAHILETLTAYKGGQQALPFGRPKP